MSIKPLPFVGTDLWRARQILKSWTSLRRLTSDETEIVVRMIAQGLAEGRERGFDLAAAERLSASQDYVDALPDVAGA